MDFWGVGRRFVVVAALVLGVVVPSVASAAVVPERAGLEDGTFAEFGSTNAAAGSLTNTAARAFMGSRSARASYAGGGANGYARGLWKVAWGDGDEVWYGAAYYLPVGFKAAMQGQVDLVRWDNYESMPTATEKGGVVIYGSDKKARLVRIKQGVEQVALGSGFEVPEGRWFWLEVHQKLSVSAPLSEVYVDGTLVGSSTAKNSYGSAIERIRFGLVAISDSKQLNPLELWFDNAGVGGQPLTEAPAPAPPPDTTIVSGPSTSTSSAAQFDFQGSRTGVTFECRLDGGAWQPCQSPHGYAGLAPGPHAFEVRAKDGAGQADATPAVWSWSVLEALPVVLFAGFESGSCANRFDGSISCASARGSTQASGERAYAGSWALKAATSGGGATAYARTEWKVSWPAGKDVRYGAAFYLPVGFKAALQGKLDLLMWDNYGAMPTQTERGGIVISTDKRARLVRHKDGIEHVALTPGFELPEGRWFQLEVRQRLSRTNPTSDVLIDGTRVASSTAHNSYGHTIDRIRSGLIATAGTTQQNPLTLFLDSPYTS